MRNQLQTWFLPDDENELSHSLRHTHPSIFFIDSDEAGKPDVVAHTELQHCRSLEAWIWDAATKKPDLAAERWRECVKHKNTGAAVQFIRSRLICEELVNETSANVLLNGRVAACFRGKGTLEQINLKRTVFKAVDAISTSKILHVSPTSRESLGKMPGCRAGWHTAKWCETKGNLLRHSGVYGLPAECAEEAED